MNRWQETRAEARPFLAWWKKRDRLLGDVFWLGGQTAAAVVMTVAGPPWLGITGWALVAVGTAWVTFLRLRDYRADARNGIRP